MQYCEKNTICSLLLDKTHQISVTLSPVDDSQMASQTCHYSCVIYLQT